MYVEVSDVKKSYGEGGSYMQVLKGVSVGTRRERCVSFRERVVPVNPHC